MGAGWKRQWIRTFSDGFASKGITPGNFFLLSRSAWLGTAAFGHTAWSGDLDSSWSDFQLQIQAGQGAALSGIAHWTTDIGGYNNGNPADPSFQELIVRWFQFGAFSPVTRLHGHRETPSEPPGSNPACWETHGDNEIYNLLPQADQYNAVVTVLRLRETLRQYVLGIDAEYVATGMPLIRPMILVCGPLDTAACTQAEQQFMFGPDWLIAPITQPVATAPSMTVYLPSLAAANQTWTHWWSGRNMGPGGNTITWTFNGTFVDFPLYKRQY